MLWGCMDGPSLVGLWGRARKGCGGRLGGFLVGWCAARESEIGVLVARRGECAPARLFDLTVSSTPVPPLDAKPRVLLPTACEYAHHRRFDHMFASQSRELEG